MKNKNYKVVREGDRYTIAHWDEARDAFIINDGIYGYYWWDSEEDAQKAADAYNAYDGQEWLGQHGYGNDTISQDEIDSLDLEMVELYRLFGAIEDVKRYYIEDVGECVSQVYEVDASSWEEAKRAAFDDMAEGDILAEAEEDCVVRDGDYACIDRDKCTRYAKLERGVWARRTQDSTEYWENRAWYFDDDPDTVLDADGNPFTDWEITKEDIIILSGEGEIGTYELYEDRKSPKVIRDRLEKERCGGDRWAQAFIYSHDSKHGPVYIDFESGEQRHISDEDIS